LPIPVCTSEDFVHLQALSREEQEKRLRDLKERGEKIAAIYMARKIYGCGLAQARSIVENLHDDTQV
jgi:ribosomal protein L7/L12